MCMVYCQVSLGPVDPSFRALDGRLKFTVRRHEINKDSFSTGLRQEAQHHHFTQGDFKVVLQKSTPPQVRQLIPHYY